MLTKDPRMITYKVLVLKVAKKFKDVKFINVLGDVNLKADQLVVETL